MKHLNEYIKEAQEIALTTYIKELKKEFINRKNDEDIYLDITAKLYKYLNRLSNAEIKSLCSQLNLGDKNDDIETNKSHILLYITNI